MKTLREYIDLIAEAQEPDWKAIVAAEVKARGLPPAVKCGIRYNTDYSFQVDYDNGKSLDVWYQTYGKGQAVATDDPSNSQMSLAWLYGPDIADSSEFDPSYTDTASLIETITQFCLTPAGQIENIYIDLDSHWDKGGRVGSVTDGWNGIEDVENPEEELDQLVSESGFSSDDYFDFFMAGKNGTLKNPRIQSVTEDDEALEREISGDVLGAALVTWPNLVLHFEAAGGKVKLLNRGKSQDAFTGEFEPEEPAAPAKAVAPKKPASPVKPVAPKKPTPPAKPTAPNPAQQPPEDDQIA